MQRFLRLVTDLHIVLYVHQYFITMPCMGGSDIHTSTHVHYEHIYYMTINSPKVPVCCQKYIIFVNIIRFVTVLDNYVCAVSLSNSYVYPLSRLPNIGVAGNDIRNPINVDGCCLQSSWSYPIGLRCICGTRKILCILMVSIHTQTNLEVKQSKLIVLANTNTKYLNIFNYRIVTSATTDFVQVPGMPHCRDSSVIPHIDNRTTEEL